MNTFTELARQRRSIRTYTDESLSEDQVVELMKAALMSPTSKNSRAWEFILVDDKALLHQLSECKPMGAQHIVAAPLAIVVAMRTADSEAWIEDAAAASMMLLLQAEDLGLGACWIQIRGRRQEDGTLSSDMVREILRIPEDYEVATIISVGHKAVPRKPQNEDKLLWERISFNEFGKK